MNDDDLIIKKNKKILGKVNLIQLCYIGLLLRSSGGRGVLLGVASKSNSV